IAYLRSLALDALRRRWRVVFGRTPPAALSKDLLGRMIAWCLQEQAFGGLDRESLRLLEGLARHGGSPRRKLKPGKVTRSSSLVPLAGRTIPLADIKRPRPLHCRMVTEWPRRIRCGDHNVA